MDPGTQRARDDNAEQAISPSPNVSRPEPDASDLVALKYRDPTFVASEKLARGIGLFSIGLGLAELLAPRMLGDLIGVNDKHRKYLPALGIREIGHGIGVLSSNKPTAAIWSRVGGDAIDLAYLGSAFTSEDTNKTRLAVATAAVMGVGLLDLFCAQQLSSQDWYSAEGNPEAPTTIGQPSGRAGIH